MASEVDICNLALSNVRAGKIASLNETSEQARQCALKYPLIRDMLLKDTAWGFNHKITALTQLTTGIFDWVYSYRYPEGCLYINRLVRNYEQFTPSGVRPPERLPAVPVPVSYDIFNVDNKLIIAANEAELRISYRARILDPTLFDNTFLMAFSWMLSAELAIPLVGGEIGRGLRKDALAMYQSYMNAAVSATMNQHSRPEQESEFITVRG